MVSIRDGVHSGNCPDTVEPTAEMTCNKKKDERKSYYSLADEKSNRLFAQIRLLMRNAKVRGEVTIVRARRLHLVRD